MTTDPIVKTIRVGLGPAAAFDLFAHRILNDGEVRNKVRELLRILKIQVVNPFTRHRRHGDGNILQALLTLLSRNDDLF